MKDCKIASKRVHVETVIGLGKTYKMLCQHTNITESNMAYEIISVCFRLCNFCTRIVQKMPELYPYVLSLSSSLNFIRVKALNGAECIDMNKWDCSSMSMFYVIGGISISEHRMG